MRKIGARDFEFRLPTPQSRQLFYLVFLVREFRVPGEIINDRVAVNYIRCRRMNFVQFRVLVLGIWWVEYPSFRYYK